MKCAKCGAEVAEGAHFCLTCGNDLFAQAQAEAQPVREEPVAKQPEPEAAPKAAPEAAPVQQAPQYAPYPPYQAPVVQQIVQEKEIRTVDDLPKKFRPIKMWGYFGIELLFAIPVVGFIFMLVWAFGGTRNINKRNFARSKFCYLIIGLVLTVIALIIMLLTGVTVPQIIESIK
ncbi:MAG: zinc ribbon domain-containing protein [Clostridia bacterium]|nr:zinc ribbon domain-containing protein [Clostridia bacterium]